MKKKKKEEDRSHLIHLDCVENKNEQRHSDPSLLFFLSIPLFFLFLSQRELASIWILMKHENYFTIQLIFATIHRHHYTFWYYS